MAISLFELFTVGIGPSSSHTVGPMRAARMFREELWRAVKAQEIAGDTVVRIQVALYGSLGATGRGHGSDRAVCLGLLGFLPETVEPSDGDNALRALLETKQLALPWGSSIDFTLKKDLVFLGRQSLPLHPNGMRVGAFAANGEAVLEKTYYSVGGGFVIEDDPKGDACLAEDATPLPHPFGSGLELQQKAERSGKSIAELMLCNEQVWRPEVEIRAGILELWHVMQACVQRGLSTEGVLPGKLGVARRAPALHARLRAEAADLKGGAICDPLAALDWINLYALAVNEENAAGGRVVTAPTNGAAGVLPAVLHHYRFHLQGADDEGIVRFFLTAAAIAILYKKGASISGAEVGCQGEVGVACSMAAGGLVAAQGGSATKIANAAEIAMEHNLGLTCDPVGGLVQVPCIERNAMGAVKAINAARMAPDGPQKVSLDKVIATMRQTGEDMKTKYKETSRGGLAINVIEC